MSKAQPESKRSHEVHGHARARSKTYLTWQGILQRCTNPTCTKYPQYGGRGITVCDSWRNSFVNFLSDMGERPEGKTIDRKNNALGYCKENCRWASRKEQQRNTRRSRMIEFRGERMSFSELAERSGLSPMTLHKRIDGLGWSIERAVTQPVFRDWRNRSWQESKPK